LNNTDPFKLSSKPESADLRETLAHILYLVF